MTDSPPFIPFAKPCLSEEAIDEVVRCLRSGWITTGPLVEKFEADLGEYFGAPHALTLSSATAGLHLALAALDLQPGDEVITTSMTFAATLNTIIHAGARPVLVDVNRADYNIDTNKMETALSNRTRAIVPVHFAGLPVDLDPLYEFAKRHKLTVIEDAAHAIGSEYKGKRIGSFGDIQVFSFHPNKNITTGEGGCVVTRDPDIAARITQLRFHGIEKNVMNQGGRKSGQIYDVVAPGFKYNMMDIQAALGLHQLPALSEFNRRRAELSNTYFDRLSTMSAWNLPAKAASGSLHAWHLFAPTIIPESAGMARDEFIARMREKNIGLGLHYSAPHLFEFYSKEFGYSRGDFPNAENIADTVVSLPLFPDMTDNDQDRIIEAISELCN